MTLRVDSLNTKQYQPFVKWVGGKRGLIEQLIPLFPTEFEDYHKENILNFKNHTFKI
jgi:hypothetical protein